MEGALFTAYKCTQQGVYGQGSTKKVVLTKMTMMDNMAGFGYAAAIPGDV